MVKNFLYESEFRCNIDSCTYVYKYENAEKHILTHQQTKRSCTLNCGSQDLFVDDADLKDHLANSCPKVNLICADCEQRYERWVFESHSCLSALKNLTLEQKQQIAERDAMIAALEVTKDQFQATLVLKDSQIAEKQAQLVKRDALVAEKMDELSQRDALIAE